MKKPASYILLCGLLAGLLSTSGCYKYLAVQPTELPKLNGVYSEHVGNRQTNDTHWDGKRYVNTTRTTPIIRSSRIPMKTPQGRLIAIDGIPDKVRITRTNGRSFEFAEPYTFTIEGDQVTVLSSNFNEFTLPLADISRAEIQQSDQGSQILWGFVGLMLGLGLAMSMAP